MRLGDLIVFIGEQRDIGNGLTYFKIIHNDLKFAGSHMGCMGYAKQLLDGREFDCFSDIKNLFHDTAPIATWGFYGEGTRMLAVTMLAIALKRKFDDWPRDAHRHRHRDKIIKLHDKYAREVLAKLPPNWTITGEEVNEWVKQQRKKHDKILREDNQKPVTV